MAKYRLKTWLKRIAVAGTALLVLAFLALEILRVVGTRAGVESVALPAGSEIEARSDSSDYSDAYRAAIPRSVSFNDLIAYLSQGGGKVEVIQDRNEVLYEGRAPGLRYTVSYLLSPGARTTHLTISTSVFYESALGVIYFTPVKQVHRRALPFFVSREVRSLVDKAASSGKS